MMPAMPEAPTFSAATNAQPAGTPPAATEADVVVRRTRALAVGSLIGLIVLGLTWELWLAPTGSGTLALKVLPLFIPLGGLLRHRMYTYRWVSLMVWLYFTEGVVRAFSDPGLSAVLAGVEVVLCLVLFTACAWHVRWRLKQAAGAAPVAAAGPPAQAPAARP